MNTLVEKARLEGKANAEGLPRKTAGRDRADGGVRTVAVAAASIGSSAKAMNGVGWRKKNGWIKLNIIWQIK